MFETNVLTVPSGTYEVRKRDTKILRAFLGSCVGVVLVDHENKIGGLLHILLAEPPAKGAVIEPEKYASTAIPLFLEAMYQEGAQKENLKAYVAGGSLVGEVSLMDLNLDIGGQSTEVVENYLKLEEIEIVQVETGGYLSAQISVDLKGMQCKIDSILSVHPSLARVAKKHNPPNIDEAIKKIKPIPQIALKVIRLIHSTKLGMNTIANEIRKDQILSGKVIQLCNSAYINPGREIKSIDQAMVLLGERKIYLLTLSVFTEMFYQSTENGYSLIKGGLFRHAQSVAYLAEHLAEFTNAVPPDQAYTAGLLHDIGKTALDQAMSVDYPLFYKKLMEDNASSLLDIEKEVFGYSHTEIGSRLAETWGLPENLTNAITYHHQPVGADQDAKLVHLVFLANILSNRFAAGNSVNTNSCGDLKTTLKVLQIDSDKISTFIDSVRWEKLQQAGFENFL